MSVRFVSIVVYFLIVGLVPPFYAMDNIKIEANPCVSNFIDTLVNEFCSTKEINADKLKKLIYYICNNQSIDTEVLSDFWKYYHYLTDFAKQYEKELNNSGNNMYSNLLDKVRTKYNQKCPDSPKKIIRTTDFPPSAPRFEDGPEYKALMHQLKHDVSE